MQNSTSKSNQVSNTTKSPKIDLQIKWKKKVLSNKSTLFVCKIDFALNVSHY